MVIVLIFAFYEHKDIVAPVQINFLCSKTERLVLIHLVSQDNRCHMHDFSILVLITTSQCQEEIGKFATPGLVNP